MGRVEKKTIAVVLVLEFRRILIVEHFYKVKFPGKNNISFFRLNFDKQEHSQNVLRKYGTRLFSLQP